MGTRRRRIIAAVTAGLLMGASVGWATWDVAILLADVIRRAPSLSVTGPVREVAPSRADGRHLLESRLFEPSRPPPAAPPVVATACDSSLRLVGAFVDTAHTARSLAVLQVANASALVGREGDGVSPWVIERIAPSSVLLRDADRSCALALFGGAPPASGPVPRVAPGPASPVSPAFGSIQRLGPNQVEVPRELVLSALSGASPLPTTVRFVPTPEGLRVFGMRRSDPLAQLGLRNGDVIQAVDGHPPTELDAMLRLAEELPERERVHIIVARPGGAEMIEVLLR